MSLSGDVGGVQIEIRESPSLPSPGETTVTDNGAGRFVVDSFFDVFTELSVGGGPFQPQTNGAGRMDLEPIRPDRHAPEPGPPARSGAPELRGRGQPLRGPARARPLPGWPGVEPAAPQVLRERRGEHRSGHGRRDRSVRRDADGHLRRWLRAPARRPDGARRGPGLRQGGRDHRKLGHGDRLHVAERRRRGRSDRDPREPEPALSRRDHGHGQRRGALRGRQLLRRLHRALGGGRPLPAPDQRSRAHGPRADPAGPPRSRARASRPKRSPRAARTWSATTRACTSTSSSRVAWS